MEMLKRKTRRGLDREQRTAVTNVIRRTSGPLRLDQWDALSADQQHRLHELTTQASAGGGFDVATRLNAGERTEWEHLVELCSGHELGSVFQKARQDAATSRRFAELAARARRPPPRPTYEEEGSIRLPRLAFDHLDRPDPGFFVGHLGLLAFVLLQLENGKALVPRGWIDGAGDTAALVITGYGLGAKFDGESQFVRWRDDLDHLAKNRWLAVEHHGQDVWVRRGPATLAANAARAAA